MARLFGVNRKLHKQLEMIRPRLYRLAFSWCHSPHLADDLTQETLARALKNLHQLHDSSGFDKWCFKILINCWRSHLRSFRELADIDDYVLQEVHTPESLHQQQRITEQVKKAIAKLPQGQRHVVTLVDIEGFCYNEVAEILEIPIGTVMSRLCRARKHLAESILERPAQPIDPAVSLRRIK